MKKVISLLLSAAMSFSVVATAAFAAEGNVQFSFDKDTYKPGEEITVTIDSLAKTISTDGFNVAYDTSKIEAVTILDDAGYADGEGGWWTIQYLNPRGQQLDREFSVHEINHETGVVGFGFANTEDVDYLEKLGFAQIKFKVKDDATGTAIFTLNENSGGADGYVGVNDTKEITIESDTPAPQPAVNSVTIDQGETATVNGGETLQLSVTVDAVNGADATVTWSIDPATPATISPDGLFTAPEATEEDQVFTVKATSNFNAEVSDSIEITVPKKEDEPQPQQPTTDITANNGTGGVYFDVTMNGNGESITDANVVVAGPTADGEGKEVTFNIINYGDVQGELSFILGILTEIAGEYTGTSNVTTGVGTATDSASVTFPAQ